MRSPCQPLQGTLLYLIQLPHRSLSLSPASPAPWAIFPLSASCHRKGGGDPHTSYLLRPPPPMWRCPLLLRCLRLGHSNWWSTRPQILTGCLLSPLPQLGMLAGGPAVGAAPVLIRGPPPRALHGMAGAGLLRIDAGAPATILGSPAEPDVRTIPGLPAGDPRQAVVIVFLQS